MMHIMITSQNRSGLPDFSHTMLKTWRGLGTRVLLGIHYSATALERDFQSKFGPISRDRRS